MRLFTWNNNLAKELKNGSNKALEQCYRVYSAQLYSTILMICRNESIAQDLLHDVFVKLYEKVQTYDERGNFGAWIKRVALNLTVDYVRKVGRIESDCSIEQIVDTANTMLDIQNEQLIDYLFKQLSLKERTIVWLYIVEQYSHQEIADMNGTSQSYSKSIVSRALNKIRQSQTRKASNDE